MVNHTEMEARLITLKWNHGITVNCTEMESRNEINISGQLTWFCSLKPKIFRAMLHWERPHHTEMEARLITLKGNHG